MLEFEVAFGQAMLHEAIQVGVLNLAIYVFGLRNVHLGHLFFASLFFTK